MTMTYDDGFSPDHYNYARAEATDAAGRSPYYDDRPTRAEAERDQRDDEARGRP